MPSSIWPEHKTDQRWCSHLKGRLGTWLKGVLRLKGCCMRNLVSVVWVEMRCVGWMSCTSCVNCFSSSNPASLWKKEKKGELLPCRTLAYCNANCSCYSWYIDNYDSIVDDGDSIMPLSDNVILVHLTWVKYNNYRLSADDRPVYHSYITHACWSTLQWTGKYGPKKQILHYDI